MMTTIQYGYALIRRLNEKGMKKIKIITIIHVGIMRILLLLAYITDYIERHASSPYPGLSTIGWYSVLFLLAFFVASGILVLLLYVIITGYFVNKSMDPLKVTAAIDGVVMNVSFLLSFSELDFLADIFLISLSIFAFIILVVISVFIIRTIKKKRKTKNL